MLCAYVVVCYRHSTTIDYKCLCERSLCLFYSYYAYRQETKFQKSSKECLQDTYIARLCLSQLCLIHNRVFIMNGKQLTLIALLCYHTKKRYCVNSDHIAGIYWQRIWCCAKGITLRFWESTTLYYEYCALKTIPISKMKAKNE